VDYFPFGVISRAFSTLWWDTAEQVESERSDCQSRVRFRFKEKERGSAGELRSPWITSSPSRSVPRAWRRGQSLYPERSRRLKERTEPRLTGWSLGGLTSIIFGIANIAMITSPISSTHIDFLYQTVSLCAICLSTNKPVLFI
jgi:hypothetical protein